MWTRTDIEKSGILEPIGAGELQNYCNYILEGIELTKYIEKVPQDIRKKVHEYRYEEGYIKTVISLWFKNVLILVFDIEYKGDYDNLTTFCNIIFDPVMHKEMCKEIEISALQAKWG